MRYYSKSEVEQILHITPRQLQHLLTVTGIMPTVASKDKRMHLIVNTDFERLRATHLEELRAYVPSLTDDESVMSDIEQKVIKMRAEMDDMMRRVEALERRPALAEAPRRHNTRPSFGRDDDLPEGWAWRDRFAELHGVPRGTAVNHVNKGHIQETRRPSATRGDQENHFFDPDQQRAAAAYWQQNYSDFKACPDCPHLPEDAST